MRSITARFLLAVLLFAAAFCGLILYGTWSSTRSQVQALLAREAALALEFDLAIRKYVGDYVRPSMAERVGPDEFYPETMSTSFVARNVFEQVGETFPDYIIKFSSTNPRNPANLAGPEEQRVIEYFQQHPEETRWTGNVAMGGRTYFAHFSARRMTESCMRCHGEPADAPVSLIDRYGPVAGFHTPVGAVNLDTIAIPIDAVNSALAADTAYQVIATGLMLALMVGLILLSFRHLVTRRLAAITGHFRSEALKRDESALTPITVGGHDEIGVMAEAFNVLVDRVRGLHSSLEDQVQERTEALLIEVAERKRSEERQRTRAVRAGKYSDVIVSLAKHDTVARGHTDGVAQTSTEAVAHALDVERVSVWLHNTAQTEIECLDLFERTPGSHTGGARLSAAENPAYFAALDSERAIDAHDALTDPRTAEFRDGYLRPLGITSMLDSPVRVSGQSVGVICVEHVGQKRRWDPSEMTFVGEVADQMATALLNAERKRAQEERQELETRFRHAQKLEGLGLLAGGIAHDFNNLLMAILGNVELAATELPPLSSARQYLENIDSASRHAADLCRQMLAYSGQGRFSIRAIDLSEAVGEFVHLLQSSISKKAKLSLHLEQSLPQIEADTAQVQQLVMNLITNASEALGDDEGTIEVCTSTGYCCEQEAVDNLTGEHVPNGDYVCLMVKDSGCGMDEETRKRIFDPFFTTKFTGRGLGLAAVLGIVRSHKGILTASSSPGEGTTFVVRFPVAGPPLRAEKAREAEVAEQFTDKTVLVADDEKAVRLAVSRILENAGFEVLQASDGQEAVEVFRDNLDGVDCVVLDVTMPRMNGREAFDEMAALRDDLCVVFASGFDDPGITQNLTTQAKTDFVQKPYRSAELLSRIRRLLTN
ncbi:MAG: DUF3365 domain-containing protein [bacterium]|nr:DUF3365 domain-containing protein [bacterium]